MAKFCDIFCCFPRRRSRTPSERRSDDYVTIHGISDISSDDIFEVTADIPLIEDTQVQNVPPTTGESQMTVTEREERPAPPEAPAIKKQRVVVIVIEMVKPLPEESQDGCESLIEKTEPEPEKTFQPPETPACDDSAGPSPCAVSSSECGEPAETLPPSLQSEACECDVPVEVSSGPKSAISLQDFTLHKLLGRGGFGKVMLAEFNVTKEMFAIKVIKLAESSSTGVQRPIKGDQLTNILTEREIFKTISGARHPFVTSLFASFHTDDRAYFAMEYAAGGNLSIRLKSLGSFSEPMARFYTACVVLGLEFLHQQKIIHRDLKLDNIVLDKDGFAKITDFGLGQTGIGFGDRTSGVCGVRRYMAPEMIAEKPYTRDVDWWAVGVMLYKMLTAKDPFNPFYPFYGLGMERNVLQHGGLIFPRRTSSNAQDLINSLLTRSPVTRLGSQKGAQDVKDHPFFTDINWMDLLAKKTQPPFTPRLSGPQDVSYFERTDTSQSLTLTPPPDQVLGYHHEAFADFDWVAE